MSEEENKKRTTAKTITKIVATTTLGGGIVTGNITTIPKTEAKLEEEAEKKKKSTNSVSNQPPNVDNRKDLTIILPISARNLGTITTNGANLPSEAQIKIELQKQSIDTTQVQITSINNNKAIVKPIDNFTKYKGIVEVTYCISLNGLFGKEPRKVDINWHIGQSTFFSSVLLIDTTWRAIHKKFPALKMDKIKIEHINPWYYFGFYPPYKFLLTSIDKKVYTGEVWFYGDPNMIAINIRGYG